VLVVALLFLVVPIVELYVILQVAHAIGVLNTIGVLILDSIVGAWLMKREGLGVLRRLQAKLEGGELPGTELVDGFLILFGGALMLTPGFVSDIIGMIAILPPTRAVLRKVLAKRFRSAVISRSQGTDFGDVIDLP
jgi:UPF0716 protein FxsA